MHILFVADEDDKYGAPQSMKQLISELLKQNENIEISVILPLGVNLSNYYHQLGCHTYRILYTPFYQGVSVQKWKVPIKFFLRGIKYLIGRWTAIFFLSKRLDMSSIDIIHANSSREDLGAILALKYHKPLVWHIREFGDKDYKCFSFRKDYIVLMNKAANRFIAVSDAVRKHWINKGIDGKKIIRIYNGVCSEVNFKKEYKKDDDGKLRFLILGSVCETKGQYQIIRACALMSKRERERITVDIVGSGNKAYVKKLEELVKKCDLMASIHFLGYQKEAWNNIGRYDCGLMCSKSEGFGRVTVEYMMAGLPVIVSDTGANLELIVENENALQYQWNNVEDLKKKMVYLLNNFSVLRQMGENARKYAISHFSAALSAELVYKEYLNIIEKD